MGTELEAGLHTVNPYVLCSDANAVIAFLERAFDATIQERLTDGTRVTHAQVLIGDSAVMLGQPSDPGRVTPSMLYVYVADCDAAYAKAVAAGGTPFIEPTSKYYGDRNGCVTDPSGNQWWIGSRERTLTQAELQRAHDEERKRSAGATGS